MSEEDGVYMFRALELAARGAGRTHPNPAVGCVIARPPPPGGAAAVPGAPDRIVGEGFHPRAGAPHAEVYALRAAGAAARGATAYVTLEPCSHHGRTPPCAEALLEAGVVRVVVGVGDVNPLVGGAGLARLAAAGLEVVVGCQEDACRDLNANFFARMAAVGPPGAAQG